jgi:hypothetical protein
MTDLLVSIPVIALCSRLGLRWCCGWEGGWRDGQV